MLLNYLSYLSYEALDIKIITYPKLVTKSDIGWEGDTNKDITTKKKYTFLFFACFWSAWQQLSFG